MSVILYIYTLMTRWTENDNVWFYDMLLALEGRNKTRFIDKNCRRSNTDEVLGLDDSYMQLRSNILAREPLPNAKGTYALISSEESHRAVVIGLRGGTSQRIKVSHPNEIEAFITKVGNLVLTLYDVLVVPGYCVTLDFVHKVARYSKLIVGSLCPDAMDDFLLFLMRSSPKLWIKVSHPNEIEAFITKVGNLVLTDFLTLYDVLVVPEYCVTLVSVHKGRIPLNLWSECIPTACYLIKRLPNSVLKGKSPYHLVFNMKPSLKHLRVFGCLCFATVLNNHDKFGSKEENIKSSFEVNKSSQDLDHVNFFDEVVYKGLDTPYDDTNLDRSTHNEVATLITLADPTIDHVEDKFWASLMFPMVQLVRMR
ncbi:ribonuclease H-like domain-containing protein [Tanacetum coccineum]